MSDSGRHREPLQHKLEALFQSARLPTSPAVARRILRLIEDPHSTAAQFAATIEADPAMAARLLRMANSAYYGQRHAVGTIQRAVTVLGLGQLRVLALGFELVGHLDRLGGCRFDLHKFWQAAALRACLARQVALRVVPDLAEEAFLVGLLQDCGIVLLVQGLGRDYAELYDVHHGSPAAFHRAERKSFPYTHVDAIDALATLWRFPPVIAHPLVNHHRRTRIGRRSPDETRLEAVSHFVGSLPMAAADEVSMTDLADPELLRYARDDLGLDGASLEPCFEATRVAYLQMAPMLDHDHADDLDVTDLLVLANRHLQQHTSQRDERLRAMESEQVTLRKALGEYRDRAARDPLTGLLNRRALTDAFEQCLELAVAADEPLTAVFIDVDDFKVTNDRFGHQAGDEVLVEVARRLPELVGDEGLAGRYGGEEFVLVLSGLDQTAAARRMDDLLETVRAIRFDRDDRPARITCSVGAVHCRFDDVPTAETLIAAADELMYEAKRSGKDRCCFAAATSRELARTFGAGGSGPAAREKPAA